MRETGLSVKPTLDGTKVVLVPLSLDHFDTLWNALGDAELARLTGSRVEISAPRLQEWMSSRADTHNRLDLAVIAKDSQECVGEVVLNEVDFDNRSCNFRIMLAANGRDRGLGTEATRLILGYGFEALRLHRISLGVFAFNSRAQHVYEKVGFVQEGVDRDGLWWEGQWHDDIRMSILAHEWRDHQGQPGTRT